VRGASELIVHALLDKLDAGSLVLVSPSGDAHEFSGPRPGPHANVTVSDSRAFRRIATAGSMGMAEGYLEGEWDTPDLSAVLELGVENLAVKPLRTVPDPLAPVQRLVHRLRPNSIGGSRRNIAHHYDLGNDFYELWLDDTMTYSAACFEDGCGDLRQAQRRKWDRMLEIVDPRPGEHLLEIGCGWGGFAMHAAREAGCRVTGISLSQEQTEFARKRIAREGMEDLVDIRIMDYRHVEGRFDGIVSIEMFEAVGERWWPAFFAKLGRALAPGKRAALQVITIAEERFETYRRRADFIQKYIFPGGMLPSPTAFERVSRDAGLSLDGPEFFGQSYADTLEHWLDRFEAALPDVRALGFDERFVRMWRYYLAYCRAGFRAGTIDVMRVGLSAD
jgi:cyclopropane-fatty-acyl-phospholipid synthase